MHAPASFGPIQLIQAGSRNNRRAGMQQTGGFLEANVQRMEETGAIKLNQENEGGIMKG